MPALLTLALLTAGFGLAAWLLAAWQGGPVSREGFAGAAGIVAVAALAVPLPVAIGDRLWSVKNQRRDNAGTIERTARQRCVLDLGRPDVIEYLEVTKKTVPPNARYGISSPLAACMSLDLSPRRPVPLAQTGPTDWRIHIDQLPSRVKRAVAAGDPRFVEVAPTYVIERPEGAG